MTKVLIAFAATVLLVAVAWLMGWWIPNRPDPDKYPVRGIDVSHHNGEIYWQSVAQSGVKFVFMKATEGSDMTDKRFQNNWREAKKAKLIPGAYHFFSTTSSGETQAVNFISSVPKETGTLPPVIDVEFSKARSRMSDEEFYREFEIMKNALKSHYGVEPIIYTTEEFYDNYFAEKEIEYLWARQVSGQANRWAPNWLFWQYSSRGRVPGMKGRVDLNVYRKPMFEFERLLVK